MNEVEGNQLLLEIGSYGLHVIYAVIKTGVIKSTWTVIKFLRSSYSLFKNVSVRKADYIVYAEFNLLPDKFGTTRWVEEAHKVLPQLTKYVKNSKLRYILLNKQLANLSNLNSCKFSIFLYFCNRLYNATTQQLLLRRLSEGVLAPPRLSEYPTYRRDAHAATLIVRGRYIRRA